MIRNWNDKYFSSISLKINNSIPLNHDSLSKYAEAAEILANFCTDSINNQVTNKLAHSFHTNEKECILKYNKISIHSFIKHCVDNKRGCEKSVATRIVLLDKQNDPLKEHRHAGGKYY